MSLPGRLFLKVHGFYHKFVRRFFAKLRIYLTGTVVFDGEFGMELQVAIPYAYYLSQKGRLKKTVSCQGTKSLYFFSPKHQEKYPKRNDGGSVACYGFPNKYVQLDQLDTRQWIPPNYKREYQNNQFKWEREIVVISNKYAIEFGGPPCNFLDIATLQKLYDLLSPRYQVIYNRPIKEVICSDNAETKGFKDYEFWQGCKGVTSILELYQKNRMEYTYNELQLRVYANCNKFISVQGGGSVLASYFGGHNIIYCVKGYELEDGKNVFFNQYPSYSGAQIHLCRNYDDLIRDVKANYL